MITDEQHELLKDIICNTERPEKINLKLDSVSRSIVIEYDDIDDEWFKEMLALTPNRIFHTPPTLSIAIRSLYSGAPEGLRAARFDARIEAFRNGEPIGAADVTFEGKICADGQPYVRSVDLG